MASFDLDQKSGRYQIRFRYAGNPDKRSLQLDDDREAERVCGVVEETLKDLKRSRLVMAEGAEIGSYRGPGGLDCPRKSARRIAFDSSKETAPDTVQPNNRPIEKFLA